MSSRTSGTLGIQDRVGMAHPDHRQHSTTLLQRVVLRPLYSGANVLLGPIAWEAEVAAVAPEEPEVLSTEQAAKALGVGLTTVKSLVKSGALRSFKIGDKRLIRRRAIDEFIADRQAGTYRRKRRTNGKA